MVDVVDVLDVVVVDVVVRVMVWAGTPDNGWVNEGIVILNDWEDVIENADGKNKIYKLNKKFFDIDHWNKFK